MSPIAAVRCAILCALLVVTFSSIAASADRPNVIFIMSDDQGFGDLGCYGGRDLVTPNIDALAARGVRLTQFYSAAPVCTPSRAGMLTGRYPWRAGVVGNASSQKGAKGGLPSGEVTIAEIFQKAGYATGHFGKWHLGYTAETMPRGQGFDYTFGHMGGCIDNWSHYYYWSGPNVHDLHRNGVEVFHNGQYFPDLMLQEVTAFIEQQKEKPFFIYYAINTPHYPYQAEERWLERFRDLPYPRNLYAAFVAGMDERLGKLLAKVNALGLSERTIVVFQSDNGHSTEERAHFGGGSSGAYRGAKFSLFEGGIRVPAIISWPGVLPAAQVRGQTFHACDWLPTLCALAGVATPSGLPLDGTNVAALLKGELSAELPRPLQWRFGDGPNGAKAVREGDWKLLINAWDTSEGDKGRERVPIFLANLKSDPGEKKNVAADHPDVVARLRKLLN